ncbi:flagellar hook-length control protein FliK [Gemmobacter straminiformis]|uniref:Flagellar hook-length control protein FliK n=1 Tax=Paragemmobacter straminiformis TaxID=2045119 RepID=A0A842I7N6_9RHOB|nr:flagellar hook-length control protein FliK [Gemmobacter straminiformis]
MAFPEGVAGPQAQVPVAGRAVIGLPPAVSEVPHHAAADRSGDLAPTPAIVVPDAKGAPPLAAPEPESVVKERPTKADVPPQPDDMAASLSTAKDAPLPPERIDARGAGPGIEEGARPSFGSPAESAAVEAAQPASGFAPLQGGADPAAPLAEGPVAHRPAPIRHELPPGVPAALVQQAQTGTEGPVTVMLSPEDLGPLRFEMQGRGDAIHVALVVERPETLDLLRRHSDQLVAEFRQAGFAGASFSFSGTGGQERGVPHPRHYRAAESDGEIVTVKPRRPARDGLDLRL